MKKQIVVKLQVEGLHQWQDCPIEDVSFLRDRHRHIFHIEVRKKVSHNDRDIEIIKDADLVKKMAINSKIYAESLGGAADKIVLKIVGLLNENQ